MEEVFASPFTTPTTCYSSGRNGPFKRNGALQFATENHILSVRNGANHESKVKTSCRSLPRDASQWTCVGYAHWEEEEQDNGSNNDDTESNHDQISTVFQMEAIALLDPELIAAANNHNHNNSNLHRPDHKDDTASVATPSSSTIDGRQSKRTSVSTVGTATTAPLTSSGSYHRKSQSELSKGSHNTTSEPNNNLVETDPKALLSTEPKYKARLVLKQDRYSIHRPSSAAVEEAKETSGGNSGIYRRQFRQSSVALLDFRPLCPCIAKWERGQDDFVGIWVGSADDAVLRLYAPSMEDPRSLVPIPLPEDHFSVDSPVMALDFRSVCWSEDSRKTHTLAVACQDGTIQLITWTTTTTTGSSESLFGETIASQKVIVDGPLVCLQLDYHRLASLRAIVGSLCGFVCQLTYDHRTKSWDGPHMVVQDLYHSNLEESVLAVDLWENYVAIGTQLGRCLLYATQNSENYGLVWQVFLPYPVHDICIFAPNQSLLPSLGVTTRRSFHVFRGIHGRTGVPWKQTPKRETYHSELAKQRLSEILAGIRTENEVSDNATRQCVLEIMQELLDTVEATATKNIPEVNPENQSSAIEGDAPAHDSVIEEEKLDAATASAPIDAPHWEYSSSDEEEEGAKEAVPRPPTTGEAEC